MARRTSKRSPSDKFSVTGQGRHSRYALSDVMHCSECSTKYRRTIWCVKGEKVPVWRCCSRLDHGKQFCKKSPTIKESDLHKAVVRAMSRFGGDDYESFYAIMLGSIGDAILIIVGHLRCAIAGNPNLTIKFRIPGKSCRGIFAVQRIYCTTPQYPGISLEQGVFQQFPQIMQHSYRTIREISHQKYRYQYIF